MAIYVSHVHEPINVLFRSGRLQLIDKSSLLLLWRKCLDTPVAVLRSAIFGTESCFGSDRDEFLVAMGADLFDLSCNRATDRTTSRNIFFLFRHGDIYE